ncbi:MAG: hypothetical protein PHP30_07690 [Bacteroidales bacterium]|nr:hypothetical protein [Bacteroidales bacterium]MDD2424813.1 hypothetical protein [Bacteroidales bacterium]MDD3989958.1 hypothetical protein [Bacteroidales bacterium]MDD4639676.1 hypothetical protein [Bacteroidales bacterium]
MKTNIIHPLIIKKFNIKLIAISAIVAAAGIVALFLSYTLIGSALLIISLIIYFFKSTNMVYSPSGSYIKTESLYFDKEFLETLKNIIAKEITDETAPFKLSDNGSGRVDIVYSADKEFAAYRLFRFVPHSYEPATDMVSCTGNEAHKLLKYFDRCRS